MDSIVANKQCQADLIFFDKASNLVDQKKMADIVYLDLNKTLDKIHLESLHSG